MGKIGVLALGSHEERHGAALPLDTDAKLAAHVALEAAKRTGARFLGVALCSHELPGIDTGEHQPLEELVQELRELLGRAKRVLGVKAVVLVNAHGGNTPLEARLPELERELGLRLKLNNSLVELEGPHAATGELSLGAAVGVVDQTRLREHADPEKHPEVGFVGLREARRLYPWAEEQAQEVEKKGISLDKNLGTKLIERAVTAIVNLINNFVKTV